MDLINLKQVIKNNKEILILLTIFSILYTFNLDKYPAVWTDENYFINPAYNLAFHGFLGTTMIPGYYDIAQYTYWQMPLYLIFLTISFKVFRFGIIQARMVSVILGFFTVLFTYLLGKEIYDKKIGVLASIILINNPLFFLISREARMDIAAACFTLIAVYFLVKGLKTNKNLYYVYVGFFSMLALLSHPNAIIGVISIIIIYFKYNLKDYKINLKLKRTYYMFVGPIILVIPYLCYIGLNFKDFVSQFSSNILFHQNSTIINNLLTETTRYNFLFNFYISAEGIFSILMMIILIYSCFIGFYYLLKDKNKLSSNVLITILVVGFTLIAVIVSQKNAFWYYGILLSYLSILIAFTFKSSFSYKMNIRLIIPAILCLFVIINTFGILNLVSAYTNSNYEDTTYSVEEYVPNGSVIVGDAAYWTALHDNYTFYDYHFMVISDFKKFKIKYILYDHGHLVCYPNQKELNKFLKNNCTLIGEIPYNSGVLASPIQIYKINY